MTNNKIKILDDILIDQIAAGEVVERPASIVKELIENALDASAKEITISILNGGTSLIEVKDDGLGMSSQDMLVSVERFGTSKVSNSDDLLNISTYGFRGEALPSIASVSNLKITSREANSDQASQLSMEGGRNKEIVIVSSPVGTTVRVENLFYNVPARRKFLKTERSETNAIRGVVSDFALARPDIGFLLYDNNKELLQFPKDQNLLRRVKQSKLVQGEPVKVSSMGVLNNGLEISGFLNPPVFSSRSASKVKFLVNQRIIKSPLLIRALKDGFGSFLKPGYFPGGIISINVPPEEVDVNVHPQKTEIRFRNESDIFVAVKETVKKSLLNDSHNLPNEKVYHLSSRKDNPISNQQEIEFTGRSAFLTQEQLVANSFVNQPGDIRNDFKSKCDDNSHQVKEEPGSKYSNLRYLGQIFKLYLLFEGRENLAIFDMHAVHERITFYKLKKSYKVKKIPVQNLLIPVSITLSNFENTEYLSEKLNLLSNFGIDAELRDEEVVVRAIPSMLSQDSVSDIILNLVSITPEHSLDTLLEEKEDQYIARMACHASIRRGKNFTEEEAYLLLDQLEEVEFSGWCPHGRPVVYWISENELEARFGRVQ